MRRQAMTVRLEPADLEALARARAAGRSASELLREGLRVVGARYYAADAEALGLDPRSPYTHAFLREKAAFDRLSGRTLDRVRGLWVAVRGGRIVDSDRDLDALRERALSKSRGAAFFLGVAGGPIPEVDLPGFLVEPAP